MERFMLLIDNRISLAMKINKSENEIKEEVK